MFVNRAMDLYKKFLGSIQKFPNLRLNGETDGNDTHPPRAFP